MDNNQQSNENKSVLNDKIESSSSDIMNNESFDKIETKGLKLKKSTKDRLNLLQGKFTDAESMITALLNQYEVFSVENNDKFMDRKAEIDRFSFLLGSLKNCFINSLEMASFVEDKFQEKMKAELKKKDKIIYLLQEENNKLKSYKKDVSLEISNKDQELIEVKDSFSRVNLALTTVERQLNEKSNIIENLQSHIKSLTEISNESMNYKVENEELKGVIKKLELQLNQLKIVNEKFIYLKKDSERYKSEIVSLKNEVNEYKEYSNKLNEKVESILQEKSIQISKINDESSSRIIEIENKREAELKIANKKIETLKDELFELKMKIITLKER